MAIRHHRHVTENEGHFRDILELRLRLRLDRFRWKKRDDLVVYLIHPPKKPQKSQKLQRSHSQIMTIAFYNPRNPRIGLTAA
jgi:hypothetical protein